MINLNIETLDKTP